MKKIPKTFFNKKINLVDYIDSQGYCVNCGKHNGILGSLNGFSGLLTLVAHGYIRIVDIDCECGSTKALFDMDLEQYRAWKIP